MSLAVFEETGLDGVSPQAMFSPQGFGSVQAQESAQFKRGVLETAQALQRMQEGTAPPGTMRNLMENQGTAQFQWYMGHILQRRTYRMYRKMRGEWRSYVRTSQVPDFRPVERLWRDDAAAPMDFLQEFEQYSYTGVTGDKTTYRVAKYGRLMGLSWEDLINDDLNFLTDFPMTLANSATHTEDQFVTKLYADASGPHASVFTSARGNLLKANSDLGTAANAAISIDAIKAAIQQMRTQTIPEDDNDLPIMFSNFTVVVPNAMSIFTDLMMNTRQIRSKSASRDKGSNEYEFLIDGNTLGNVRFVVNPWLDIVSSSNKSAWYVFGMPMNARPGIEVAYLRGHRSPQLFMRQSNSRAIGSADTRGSFENDTLDYKIRGVFGGTVIDYRQMVASNGS